MSSTPIYDQTFNDYADSFDRHDNQDHLDILVQMDTDTNPDVARTTPQTLPEA